MNRVRRILTVCAVESDCAALARDAVLVAHAMHAELHLLTVLYNPFGVMGLSFPHPSLQNDYRNLLEKTRQNLRQLVTEANQYGVPAYSSVREGKPLGEILAEIRERNIDLLVLPAHRQTWLESLLTGGDNKRLLRRMPCSILYIKSEPRAVEIEEEEEEPQQQGEEMAA